MSVRYMSRFLIQIAPASLLVDDPAPPAPVLPARVVAAIPNALRAVPVRTGFHMMTDTPTVDECKLQVLEIVRPIQDSVSKWTVELASQIHIEIAGVWVKIGPGGQSLLFTIGTTSEGVFTPLVVPADGLGEGIQQTFHILFQPE